MARILIIGDPTTPLEQTRALVGRRAGHEILWFSHQRANLPGVTFLGVPAWARLNAVVRALAKPLFLRRALGRVRPDIVHVHYAQTGLMAPILAGLHPLVVTVMGGDILADQGYSGIPAMTIKMLLDKADVLTSKSDFMDAALDRIGSYGAKTKRITWGLDLTEFRADRDTRRLRQRLSIPDADLVFFDPRLGRTFYNKHVILEAFAGYLREGGPSATLVVAEALGDPHYHARLHELAARLAVSHRVRFVGAIPYAEMPDYCALADVTISVPASDGLPQTIYEAFACGSFLVVGDLPQYAGVVQDGVTARLVRPGDVKSLIAGLQWSAVNPSIREGAKASGRAYVEEHADFNVQAARMNEIYAGLLRPAPRGAR